MEISDRLVLRLLQSMELEIEDLEEDADRHREQLQASQSQVMALTSKLTDAEQSQTATGSGAMDAEIDAMRGRFEALTRKAFKERGMEGEKADKLLDHMLSGYEQAWGRKTDDELCQKAFEPPPGKTVVDEGDKQVLVDDDILKRRLHELGYVLPPDEQERRRQETG